MVSKSPLGESLLSKSLQETAYKFLQSFQDPAASQEQMMSGSRFFDARGMNSFRKSTANCSCLARTQGEYYLSAILMLL